MKLKQDPDQQLLKKLFEYDFKLTRLVRKEGTFNIKIHKTKIAGWDHISGYRYMNIQGKTYTEHRMIYVWHNGKIPEGYVVDHINNIRNDNRIENLQLLKRKQNNRKTVLYSNNKSGTMGVRYHKRDKIWYADIRVDGKSIHLGNFKKKPEAIKARKEAEKIYNFHPNHGLTLEEMQKQI